MMTVMDDIAIRLSSFSTKLEFGAKFLRTFNAILCTHIHHSLGGFILELAKLRKDSKVVTAIKHCDRDTKLQRGEVTTLTKRHETNLARSTYQYLFQDPYLARNFYLAVAFFIGCAEFSNSANVWAK